MRRRVPRLLLLLVLFLMGSSALVYGLFFHRVVFEETKQRDVLVQVNTLGDAGEPPPESGDAQAAPPEGKPPEKTPAEKEPGDNDDPFRSPSAGGGPAANSENPFEVPPSPSLPNIPGVRLKKITEDYTACTLDSEWAVVRDVTIGGVMLLPDGHLKRTYSGKPPALCPT